MRESGHPKMTASVRDTVNGHDGCKSFEKDEDGMGVSRGGQD